MSSAAPITPSDRIPLLDALRAFALFGIGVMNIPVFYASPEVGPGAPADPLSAITSFVMAAFFNGKFNSLFSFLFAIGFTLQWERLKHQPDRAVGLYLRRVAMLLLFGCLHVCIWFGDVLHIYALLAIPLLLVRRFPDRWLMLLAGLLLATSLLHLVPPPPAAVAEGKAMMQASAAESLAAFTSQSITRITQRNWELVIIAYFIGILPSLMRDFAVTMIIGLLLARWRTLQDLSANRAFFVRTAWIAGASGVVFGILAGLGELHLYGINAGWKKLFTDFSRPTLMLLYVSLFALAAQTSTWSRALRTLAIPGRMPLTNYLTQSIVFYILFRGVGFNLMGKVTIFQGFAIAMTLYLCQIVVSHLWLSRFSYGPLEYLWRLGTYGRLGNRPSAMAAGQ